MPREVVDGDTAYAVHAGVNGRCDSLELPEKQARAAECLVGELQSPALRLDAGEAACAFGRRRAAGRLDDPALPLPGDGINLSRLVSPVVFHERHGAYPSVMVHCNMTRHKGCVKR